MTFEWTCSRSPFQIPLHERQLQHLGTVLREKDFLLKSPSAGLLQVACKADRLISTVLTAYLREYSFRVQDPLTDSIDAWMKKHDIQVTLFLKGGVASSLFTETPFRSGDLDSMISISRLPHDPERVYDNRVFYRQVAYRAVKTLLDDYHHGRHHDLQPDQFFDNLYLFADNSLFLMSFAGIDFAFPIPRYNGKATTQVGSTFLQESLKIQIPLNQLRPQLSTECQLTSDFSVEQSLLETVFRQQLILIPEPEKIAHNGFERLAYALSKGWTAPEPRAVLILVREWMQRSDAAGTPAVSLERLWRLNLKKQLSKENALLFVINAYFLTSILNEDSKIRANRAFDELIRSPQFLAQCPAEWIPLIHSGCTTEILFQLLTLNAYLNVKSMDCTARPHLTSRARLASLGSSTFKLAVPCLSMSSRIELFQTTLRTLSPGQQELALALFKIDKGCRPEDLLLEQGLMQTAWTEEEVGELCALIPDLLSRLRKGSWVSGLENFLRQNRARFSWGPGAHDRLIQTLHSRQYAQSSLLYRCLYDTPGWQTLWQQRLDTLLMQRLDGDFWSETIGAISLENSMKLLAPSLSNLPLAVLLTSRLPQEAVMELPYEERWSLVVRAHLSSKTGPQWSKLALSWLMRRFDPALAHALGEHGAFSIHERTQFTILLKTHMAWGVIEQLALRYPDILDPLSTEDLSCIASQSKNPAAYAPAYFKKAEAAFIPKEVLDLMTRHMKWQDLQSVALQLMPSPTYGQPLMARLMRQDAVIVLIERSMQRFLIEMDKHHQPYHHELLITLIEMLLSVEDGFCQSSFYAEHLARWILQIPPSHPDKDNLLVLALQKSPGAFIDFKRSGQLATQGYLRELIAITTLLPPHHSVKLPRIWLDEAYSSGIKGSMSWAQMLELLGRGVKTPKLIALLVEQLKIKTSLIPLEQFNFLVEAFSQHPEGLKALELHLQKYHFPYSADLLLYKIFIHEPLHGQLKLIPRYATAGGERAFLDKIVLVLQKDTIYSTPYAIITLEALVSLIPFIKVEQLTTSLAQLTSRSEPSVLLDPLIAALPRLPEQAQRSLGQFLIENARSLKKSGAADLLLTCRFCNGHALSTLFACAMSSKPHEDLLTRLIERLAPAVLKEHKAAIERSIEPLILQFAEDVNDHEHFWQLVVTNFRAAFQRLPAPKLFSILGQTPPRSLASLSLSQLMEQTTVLDDEQAHQLLSHYQSMGAMPIAKEPLILFFDRLIRISSFSDCEALWIKSVEDQLLPQDMIPQLAIKMIAKGMVSPTAASIQALFAMPGIAQLKRLDERLRLSLIAQIEALPQELTLKAVIESGYLIGQHPRLHAIVERQLSDFGRMLQSSEEIMDLINRFRLLSALKTKNDRTPGVIFTWTKPALNQLCELIAQAMIRVKFFPFCHLHFHLGKIQPEFVDGILSFVKRHEPALVLAQIPRLTLPQLRHFFAALQQYQWMIALSHDQQDQLKELICLGLRRGLERRLTLPDEIKAVHEALVFFQKEYHSSQTPLVNAVFLECVEQLLLPHHYFVTPEVTGVLAALMAIRQTCLEQRQALLCKAHLDRISCWIPLLWNFMHLDAAACRELGLRFEDSVMEVYLPSCKQVVGIELLHFATECLKQGSNDFVYPLLTLVKKTVKFEEMEAENQRVMLGYTRELINAYRRTMPPGYQVAYQGLNILSVKEIITMPCEVGRDLTLKQLVGLTPGVILSRHCPTIEDVLTSFDMLRGMLSFGVEIDATIRPNLSRAFGYLLTNVEILLNRRPEELARHWIELRDMGFLFTLQTYLRYGFNISNIVVINRLARLILKHVVVVLGSQPSQISLIFEGTTRASAIAMLSCMSAYIRVGTELGDNGLESEPLEHHYVYLQTLMLAIRHLRCHETEIPFEIATLMDQVLNLIYFKFLQEGKHVNQRDRAFLLSTTMPAMRYLRKGVTEAFGGNLMMIFNEELKLPSLKKSYAIPMLEAVAPYFPKRFVLLMIQQIDLSGKMPELLADPRYEDIEACQGAAAGAAVSAV